MRSRASALSIVVFVLFTVTACLSGGAAGDEAATPTPELKTFSTPADADFPVSLEFTYGPEWEVQVGTNVIDVVFRGDPTTPESDPWEATIAVVDNALVHDPTDPDIGKPAAADKTKFVPWPKDLFAYFAALPGTKIDGVPTPLEVGGAPGSQMVVQTPAMQPLFWLEGDSNWLGGGETGLEPAYRRQLIFLDVEGKKVMLAFHASPEEFAAHYALAWEVLHTLKFTE